MRIALLRTAQDVGGVDPDNRTADVKGCVNWLGLLGPVRPPKHKERR